MFNSLMFCMCKKILISGLNLPPYKGDLRRNLSETCFCNRLQMRFNEMLKQNRDLKSTSSLMERKVDELTEENGVLSSQVMI